MTTHDLKAFRREGLAGTMPVEVNAPTEFLEKVRISLLDGQPVHLPGIGIITLEGRGVRRSKDQESRFRIVLNAMFDAKFLLESYDQLEKGVLPTNRD